MLSVAVANTALVCADNELLKFSAPSGQTCAAYMSDYISEFGGYLQDANTSACSYCQISDTNTFLGLVASSYGNRWRNFGIMWAFIIANVFGALFFYWLARVPKNQKKDKKEEKKAEKA